MWAGVSVGMAQKATICVMIVLILLHNCAVHLPTDEKEQSKQCTENQCCPEWHGGFLSADSMKFPFFQQPGLHGDVWFDKNKDYSADFWVCPHVTVIE